MGNQGIGIGCTAPSLRHPANRPRPDLFLGWACSPRPSEARATAASLRLGTSMHTRTKPAHGLGSNERHTHRPAPLGLPAQPTSRQPSGWALLAPPATQPIVLGSLVQTPGPFSPVACSHGSWPFPRPCRDHYGTPCPSPPHGTSPNYFWSFDFDPIILY